MNPDHLKYLRCPQTGVKLKLHVEETVDGRIKRGHLSADVKNGPTYPIVDFIPRFVSSDNYAANFGLEWQIHARTQYDGDAGNTISETRLFGVSGWGRMLDGEVILEVGSGSGRFSEHLLATGAMVVSLDFSQAVEVNYQSNGQHPNLLLVQASITEMPFEKAAFDKVLCIGVLQHTPDPRASFNALVEMIRAGGKIFTDTYLKTVMRYYLNTRYWVRPLTRTMDPAKLYKICTRYIDFMWPLARIIRRIPVVGEAINWRLLIADYYNQMPGASDEMLKEWAYLDTFDMLSPRYDIPQSPETFRRWHTEAGLTDIDVRLGDNGVIATASMPQRKPS